MDSAGTKKLALLDIFSGIGGFSLGLERSGFFRTVAFCEIEPFPRRVLKKHWPDVPIYEDVRTLTADTLQRDGIAIDAICGGFPCQDISVAGKGAGIEGERSGLWSEYARIIGEIRPRFVIVENVAALLGRGLDRVLGDLAALGYDAEWDCIPASYVGDPHNRDRIWIAAHSKRSEWQEKSYDGTLRRMGRTQQSFPWDGSWEEALCKFRGVDDGSTYRVDRVDTLRNAVVPQIPELIGRAIGAAMSERSQ